MHANMHSESSEAHCFFVETKCMPAAVAAAGAGSAGPADGPAAGPASAPSPSVEDASGDGAAAVAQVDPAGLWGMLRRVVWSTEGAAIATSRRVAMGARQAADAAEAESTQTLDAMYEERGESAKAATVAATARKASAQATGARAKAVEAVDKAEQRLAVVEQQVVTAARDAESAVAHLAAKEALAGVCQLPPHTAQTARAGRKSRTRERGNAAPCISSGHERAPLHRVVPSFTPPLPLCVVSQSLPCHSPPWVRLCCPQLAPPSARLRERRPRRPQLSWP